MVVDEVSVAVSYTDEATDSESFSDPLHPVNTAIAVNNIKKAVFFIVRPPDYCFILRDNTDMMNSLLLPSQRHFIHFPSLKICVQFL